MYHDVTPRDQVPVYPGDVPHPVPHGGPVAPGQGDDTGGAQAGEVML